MFGRSNGTIRNITVENSYLKGRVRISGIVGWNDGSVYNCASVGCVIDAADGRVGGIVGVTSNGGIIDNCYKTSAVSGNDRVGGICGVLQGGGTVTNCYNIGEVTGAVNRIGGIVGILPNNDANIGCKIENCYFNSDVFAGSGVGSFGNYGTVNFVEGKTTEQFASGEVAYLLQQGNTEQVWGQDNNREGATPILDSTGLYKVVTVGETGNYSVANVGDTNGDGTVDVLDYQELVNTILADDYEQIDKAEYDDIIRYDLDSDGALDVLDAALMHLFINGFATVDVYAVGDYDLNGVAFEEADILAMAEVMENPEKLATNKKYACDLNADGKVNFDDLNTLTSMFPLYFVGEE